MRTFIVIIILICLPNVFFGQVIIHPVFVSLIPPAPTVCPYETVRLIAVAGDTYSIDISYFCNSGNYTLEPVMDISVVGGQVKNSLGNWVNSAQFKGSGTSISPNLDLRWFYTIDGDQSEIHSYQYSVYVNVYCGGSNTPYKINLTNLQRSVTLKTPFNLPHSRGNTGFLIVDDTNAGLGSLCAGDKVTFTTYIDNSTPYRHQFTWEFFYGTGPPVPTGPQPIGTSTNEVGGVLTDHGSIEFTVPDTDYFTSTSHPITLYVRAQYSGCLSSGSISGSSSPQKIYPAAPDFAFLKSDAICEGQASVSVTGNSYYDQVKIRIVREDFLGAVVETKLNFSQANGFSYSNSTIPVVDELGNPLSYILQVGNFDSADSINSERCFKNASLGQFSTTNYTVLPNATVTPEPCYDPSVNSGSISLSPSGTGITPPFTYKWSTGSTNSSISSLAGDQQYKVIVRDKNGCKTNPDTLSYWVEEPDAIGFSLFDVQDVSCASATQGVINDGRIEVTASGGSGNFQYSVDGGAFGGSSTFTNLSAGPHTLRVKDGPCIQDLSVNPVTVGMPAEVVKHSAIDKADIECTGTTVTEGRLEVIGAGGGSPPYEYSLDNVNYSAGSEFRFLGAGDYTIYIKDSEDCVETTGPITINSDAIDIGVVSAEPLICADGTDGVITIAVNGGQAPYNVLWSDGQNSLTATNLSAGTHGVQVTDATGCEGNDMITLLAPDSIKITESFISPTCTEDTNGSISVTASGGNGGYSYTWEDGPTGASRNNLSVGTYQFKVEDQQGCQEDYEVILLPPPGADLGEDRTICAGQPVTLVSNVSGSYVWSSNNGFSSTASQVTVSEPGAYHLVVTDGNNCVSEDEVILTTSNDLLTADFLMVSEAYEGDTIVIIDISWPAPDVVSWDFPAASTVISDDEAVVEIRFDVAGTYEVQINSTLAGCSDNYVSQITVLDGPRPSTGGRIDGDELIKSIVLSPNPSDGKFELSVELREEQTIEVRVITTDGSKVLLSTTDTGKSSYGWSMTMESYPAGIYFIAVRVGSKVKILRMIKI